MSSKARSKNQLFVEGDDDYHTIIHLMRVLRPLWSPDVQTWGGELDIVRSGGDSEAMANFATAIKGTGPGRVGLVIDADDEDGKKLADRWSRVCSIVTPHLFAAPAQTTVQNGWIGTTKLGLKVGVWIMPDNTANTGALEAFLSPLVPPGDATWAYACESARRAKDLGAPFAPQHLAKSNLYTWLAWRTRPGRPYGEAVKAKELKPDGNSVAKRFADWFETVFIS